jgi:plasmid replication initiation protein
VTAAAEMHALVELFEELSAGPDRRVVVARFATRWFVLEGFTAAPLSTYKVHGPCADRGGVSLHEHAVRAALSLHRQASERSRPKAVGV